MQSLSRTSTKGSEPTVYTEDDIRKLPLIEEVEEEVNIFGNDDDSDDI